MSPRTAMFDLTYRRIDDGPMLVPSPTWPITDGHALSGESMGTVMRGSFAVRSRQ